MIPIPQRIVGSLDAPIPGDCFRCCVASVLERPYEEVPHFVQEERRPGGRYHVDLLNEWLTAEGYPFQALFRKLPERDTDPMLFWIDGRHGDRWARNPGWWLAGVRSKRYEGQHHMVVMHNDRVAFDPSDLVGTADYDDRPYEYEGWHYLFVVPEPWRVARCR